MHAILYKVRKAIESRILKIRLVSNAKAKYWMIKNWISDILLLVVFLPFLVNSIERFIVFGKFSFKQVQSFEWNKAPSDRMKEYECFFRRYLAN